MSAQVDYEQSKDELRAVIESGIFSRAPNLALLLEYVCGKYFDGQTGQIREYNIAVEALGRPASFDPRQDSIVRVEAFRLRKRLKEYYENEGSARPLRIVIPPGKYVPHFLEQPLPAANGNEDAEPAPLLPITSDLPAPTTIESRSLPALARQPLRKAALIGFPLISFALAGGLWYSRAHTVLKVPDVARSSSVPAAAAETEEIRIMCGSSVARYVGRTGDIWSGDRFFHGGSVFETNNHTIRVTSNPELFRSRREGNFSYDIPLKPGVYELHLYFAETLYGEDNTAGGGESSRVFNASINDKIRLAEFDVISDAGGSNTADEKIFRDISPASDGFLHVRFAALANGPPFLNALEVVPGIPGEMRPVRIIARARNYTDQQGKLWGADRYFSLGFAVARSEPVTGTPDPEMFAAERFGNFVYAIPVADGRYDVTLKFAETWFGPGHPGGGGAGSRVFDVYSNGTALLRNFDILRAADGPQRAIERTFHGIVPNSQGKIVLSFVPVVNYACVNAIEVVNAAQ